MTKEKKEVKNEVVKETKNEVVKKEQSLQDFAGLNLEDMGFSEEDLQSLTGLDAVGSADFRIPYATLISKASRDHEIGDIVFPDGSVIKGAKGEMAKDLHILKIQPIRVYFPTPFSPKNTFICRSLDGVKGAQDGEYAGVVCSSCEFAQYPEGGGASPCRDQRLLLCAKSDGSLFHIQIQGVGMKEFRTFMSAHVFHLLPKARNIMAAMRIEMGVKMIETDYGPFPSLDFKVNDSNPFHTTEDLIDKLHALKSYNEFAQEHAESAADQTRVQMAAGEAEMEEATGENKELF